MTDLSNYPKIREDARKYFADQQSIMCPAINEEVFFLSEGFNHILFHKHRSERDRASQIMRFKLLPRAVRLVGLTTTYQEYDETLKEYEVKMQKQRETRSRQVRYWGLIAIVDNRKIKVILRKVGNGNIHFWSIIPAWVTNKVRDQKFISTMKGNPDED